jgi:hypothetical protein
VIVSSSEDEQATDEKRVFPFEMCRRKSMKKLTTLAFVATLLVAGSAFAERHVNAAPNATFTFGVGGAAAGPSTTNNDDSCDIGVTPAATLLLPYFEVETATRSVDTFFTIVNTGYLPQIAHVVVWTDWSYPVLDFNVFLTGYDVQPLSMYDIIVNGIIAPIPNSTSLGGTSSSGTATAGGVVLSPVGPFSGANNSNPNIATLTGCAALPGKIPDFIRTNVLSLLVTGAATNICTLAGSAASTHPTATTAIGYVTVDVANNCTQDMTDSATYQATEILFDNVLTGDYEILNKAAGSNYAGGNPLVHIRAIPEGGPAGVALAGQQTNLPYTFYSRYINGQTVGITTYTGGLVNYDRRQPLPSTFAARWIQGGANAFNTSYRIWREGVTAASTTCLGGGNGADLNSALPVTAIVRFDEHENPAISTPPGVSGPVPTPAASLFPESSTTSTTSANFPQFASGSPAGDAGGWMYLDLNSKTVCANCIANLALHPTWPNAGARASQNWVIVSMNGGTGGASSNGLFGVDFDATWLGNGCTPPAATPTTTVNPGIGPAGGILVCPQGDPGCTPGVGKYTGTNTTP